MKLRELKEKLNQTDEMDEFEVFVAPVIEINQLALVGDGSMKTRSTTSIFERYRATTVQQVLTGKKQEGEGFDFSMVIGFDSSTNFGVKPAEESEINEFVN